MRLALLLAAAGCTQPLGTELGGSERTALQVAPLEPIDCVAVDNPLGDVEVSHGDGATLAIESIKRAVAGDALARLHVSVWPTPGGTWRVQTDDESPGRDVVRVDSIVRAPHTTRVALAASTSTPCELVP